MKTVLITILALFTLSAVAAPDFTRIQREAVRFMVEESEGRFDGEMFVEYMKVSKVLSRKELKKFPEVIVHPGYHYVEIEIDDCVYDVAIVVVDPENKGLSTLYIDFSERN